ncbi:hypothetical protein [Nitrosophilus labii]|uniref:hypothetical protein n=1 Tax=Nitrosophilus labii TaxID=2706014 RepID=UPI001656ADE1|nr:hypothetical protein [Nitrosophilus labii]
MAWKITKAFNKKLKEPICSADWDPSKDHNLKYEFRLLDDDGNVYGYGYSDDDETENAFSPLDDFGMGAWGCTAIQYKNKRTGKWEYL